MPISTILPLILMAFYSVVAIETCINLGMVVKGVARAVAATSVYRAIADTLYEVGAVLDAAYWELTDDVIIPMWDAFDNTVLGTATRLRNAKSSCKTMHIKGWCGTCEDWR